VTRQTQLAFFLLKEKRKKKKKKKKGRMARMGNWGENLEMGII
jgi:hypothetical protein